MNEFKIGDRVMILAPDPQLGYHVWEGRTGAITHEYSLFNPFTNEDEFAWQVDMDIDVEDGIPDYEFKGIPFFPFEMRKVEAQ